MRRWSFALALALVFLVGCSAEVEPVPELLDPVGVKIDTAIAERGEIYKIDFYDASVKPYVEELYLTISGSIEKVYVTLGQQVKAGDPLISLDQTELQKQVDELTESIQFAETEIDYQNQLADLDIQIAEVELAKLMSDRTAADADTAAALAIDIQLKQADIEAMRVHARQQEQLAQLALQEQRAELTLLSGQLGLNLLVAPFDGRIVEGNALIKGDWVQAYTTLAFIADDTRLSIKSKYVPETYVETASEVYALIGDDKCEITYIPIDQQEYIAAVLSGVEITSEFTVNGPAEALKDIEAGMYAAVCLTSGLVQDALLVPTNALFRDATGRYVYVVENGSRVRREVKIGLSTDVHTQILSGIEEGDEVYVKD